MDFIRTRKCRTSNGSNGETSEMNMTEEQMALLVSILNTMFTEGNYESEQFCSQIATDDLDALWELRGDLIESMDEYPM